LFATRFDVGIAMVFAGAVNLAMLLLAATALSGIDGVDTLAGVHSAIGDHLGNGIALLFAIGLLASGFASTSVGCYAGAVVMGGLLRRQIPLLARRLLTLVPALALLAVGVNPTWALVFSQVALSFGIPFALIPLVLLTARRSLMGAHVNRRLTTAFAWLIAAAVIVLNVALIYLTVLG
jgi:manganese transport protein